MIEINKTLQTAIRHGDMTRSDVEQYVMQYSMSDIISTCAELLMRYSIDRVPKIVISQEDFNNHFRLVGYGEDNTTREKRGRKPKEVEQPL